MMSINISGHIGKAVFLGWMLLCSGMLPVATAQPASEEASFSPASAPPQIGDATMVLLEMQADGSAAAPTLPMLGVTAELSWQRYLDSYKYPIPEFYENKIQKLGSGGSGQ
jgi:hypothetical protein